MRKPDVIGLYTVVPWDEGSISESAQRRIRPFYIPLPHLCFLLSFLRALSPVCKCCKARESDPDAGKSARFHLFPLPPCSSFSLTPDSLIMLVFLPSSNSERLSSSSRILRIGLAFLRIDQRGNRSYVPLRCPWSCTMRGIYPVIRFLPRLAT